MQIKLIRPVYFGIVLLFVMMTAGIGLAAEVNVELVGKYEVFSSSYYLDSVAILDNNAYVIINAPDITHPVIYSDLERIDISNPTRPEFKEYMGGGFAANDVALSGTHAYLTDIKSLQIVPLTLTDSSFDNEGTYSTDNYASVSGVAVSGNYAYLNVGGSSLVILYTTNPSTPKYMGRYDTGGYGNGDATNGIAVASPYAYLATPGIGLVVVDVSSPSSPKLAGSCDIAGDARDVAVSGKYAYVISNRYASDDYVIDLDIIDITNPSSPKHVSSYFLSDIAGGYGYGYDIAVSGNYAYIADSYNGLAIVDISNPLVPTLAGSYDITGGAKDVAVSGDNVYLAAGNSGLLILRTEIVNQITVGEGAATPEIEQLFINAYNRNGGLNVLGNPATIVHEAFGYQVQDFPGASGIPGGVIMYNPSKNNAYYIHGAIWNMYYDYTNKAQLGPVAEDELEAATSPQGTTGRYTKFQTGTIHWISNENNENVNHPQRDKAFATYGDLDKLYTDIGGTFSDLGFPIRNQENRNGHEYCEFEGGKIEWDDSIGSYQVKLDNDASVIDIVGVVKYSDLSDLTLQPLKYAKIELDSDQDSKNGILGSGNTESDGTFIIKIKDEDNLNSVFVRIYADTIGSNVDKVVVHSVGSDEVFYYTTQISKSTSFNEIAPTVDDGYDLNNDNIFRIYSNILASYAYCSNYLDLGKVTVKLDNTAETGSYANSAMTINFNKYSETHDDIELYHEYGHFVMDSPHGVFLGIPESMYYVTEDSFDVCVDEAPNSEYAWIEGWAIFSSAAINGNEKIPVGEGLNAYTIDLERGNSPNDMGLPRYDFPKSSNAPKSSKNGIRNAAFLWDMYDGKGGWDITEQADQFDGGNDIQNIVDIITDEKVYSTQYGNHETYEHQTPLSVKEFYDSWVSSGKPQRNELTELMKYHFKEYKHLKAYSPVNLHLFDSNGNHIGVNNTTSAIDKEIVGSYYSGPESHPEEIFVINSDDNNDFSCVIKGEEEGTFSLEFENAGNGKVVNTTYENVTVKTDSIGYLETSIDDEQHLLNMDYDGDGVIDESIAPSSIEIDETDGNSHSSITNLQATSGTTWLNFTWTNPTYPDFNHIEIYLDGIFQANTSAEYFNTTGLEPGTSHTIGTRTVDINGNVSHTWVNLTATTLSDSKSGGGGGGSSGGSTSSKSSGGGGGGAGSAEDYANVALKDVDTQYLRMNTNVTYEFMRDGNPIQSVSFYSLKNSGEITSTIEVLNNRSKLVNSTPEGSIYKYVNIWVGKSGFATAANIKDAKVRFKVNSSWLEEIGVSPADVKLQRYNDTAWEVLPTTIESNTTGYVIFEAQTPGFSPFAITAEKVLASSTSDNMDTISTQTEKSGMNGTQPEKIPGFGFNMAILIVGVFAGGYVYLKRRQN